MHKGIFVTGTDTGVGKTYVACSIARALRVMKVSVGVMKPIASGDREDAEKLITASKVTEELDEVNPIVLKYPLAPLVAARLEGKKLDLSLVWDAYKKMRKSHDFMVIEGVGGIVVPIKENYFVLDMIKRFSLPALVVARPGLGTLNHTLLTVDRLRRDGIKVAGVILSGATTSTLAEKTNPAMLRELAGLEVLELPFSKEIVIKENLWIIGEKQS